NLGAPGLQGRDPHESRLADAEKKKPGDCARFFQDLAHVMDPLRRLFAGTGKLRRRGADRSYERGAAVLRPGVGTHHIKQPSNREPSPARAMRISAPCPSMSWG